MSIDETLTVSPIENPLLEEAILTNGETKTVEQYVEAYLSEWLSGLDQSNKSQDQLLEILQDAVTLNNWSEMGNYVSYKGYQHLEQAAEFLLNRIGEQRRLSRNAAIECLARISQTNRCIEPKNLRNCFCYKGLSEFARRLDANAVYLHAVGI